MTPRHTRPLTHSLTQAQGRKFQDRERLCVWVRCQYTFTAEVPFSKVPNPHNAQIEPCDELAAHPGKWDGPAKKERKKGRKTKVLKSFTQQSFMGWQKLRKLTVDSRTCWTLSLLLCLWFQFHSDSWHWFPFNCPVLQSGEIYSNTFKIWFLSN